MKRILLALGLLLGLSAPALAQVPCISVGGVNSVPQVGVTCAQEPSTTSYSATAVGVVPASATTDLACITGSPSKVTRIQSVRLSGTAGTAINVPVTLLKRAVADTGGTAATGTALPVPYAHDSNNAAAVATTTAYTGNPTINDASPGILDSGVLVLTATGTLADSPYTYFDYSERNFVQAIILRSAAQQVCVNLNATSPSSGVVNVTFRWTEAAQ